MGSAADNRVWSSWQEGLRKEMGIGALGHWGGCAVVSGRVCSKGRDRTAFGHLGPLPRCLSLCTCPHSSETGPFLLSFLTENEEPLKKRHYSVMMLGEKTILAPANTCGKRPPSSCCPHATPESWRSWPPHILLERREGRRGWLDGWMDGLCIPHYCVR